MTSSKRPSLIVISLAAFVALVIFGLGDALTPLVLSFILAYLLFPLVKKLERKGINRNYSVPLLFGIVLLVAVTAIALVVPSLLKDANAFLKELPAYATKVLGKLELLAANAGFNLDFSKETIAAYLKENVSGSLVRKVSVGLHSSLSNVAGALIAILNLFLIPLFFFYVINDYEKLARELEFYIPPSFQPKIDRYLSLTNDVLSGYIRGQLMVALSLSGLYAIGLSLVGLKFGFLIGLLSGLLSIIPYAGFALGFLASIIVGLANFSGPGQLAGIVAVFTVVQAVEGTFITPKLVGDKVGLSALATILVLIVGGNLLGLTGMLIAIPIAAIAKSVIRELKYEYRKLEFYNR